MLKPSLTQTIIAVSIQHKHKHKQIYHYTVTNKAAVGSHFSHCHLQNRGSLGRCPRHCHTLHYRHRDLWQGRLCNLQKHRCEVGLVSLALAFNHLNDSLGSWWKNIPCGWLELPIIILVVAVLQWIQLNLLRNGNLAPGPSLIMRPQDMLLEGPSGRWQPLTFCLIFAK